MPDPKETHCIGRVSSLFIYTPHRVTLMQTRRFNSRNKNHMATALQNLVVNFDLMLPPGFELDEDEDEEDEPVAGPSHC